MRRYTRYYPYAIFVLGFGLLLSSTLASPGLVGSDIHTEYYFYNQALENGWDPSIAHSYNSAIGTTVIAPWLTNTFGIDGYTIFKVIYPFLFAFVPVLLYFMFRKEFGETRALLSAVFFVMIPTWSLEMIGLPRQQLAEIMLAACLFLVIVSRWGLRIKVPLVIGCSIIGAMFHYTLGGFIFLYLGLGALFLLFFRRRTFPVRWLTIIIVIFLAGAIGYYSWVASGVPLNNLAGTIMGQIERTFGVDLPPITLIEGAAPLGTPFIPEGTSGLSSQEPLLRTAFGLDFADASLEGKIFRVFQFGTQICIVVGGVWIFRNRKKYSAEYLAFAGAAVILLVAVVLLPRFSNIINATRMYHLALFMLAPCIIVGGQVVFRNLRVFGVALLIPYFLFTSGIIFELTKQTDISKINIPYSIGMSGHRIDITGLNTWNDIYLRDWAHSNDIRPMYLDINGMLLFSEKYDWSGWLTDWSYLPSDLNDIAPGSYIYLREWNTQREEITFKPNWFNPGDTATGMRQFYTFEEIGLDEILKNSKVIHQIGDATIWKVD